MSAPLVGRRVVIDGLRSKPELNGTKATVTSFDDAKGRYNIKLEDGTGSVMALKPGNLRADGRASMGAPRSSQAPPSSGRARASTSAATSAKVSSSRQPATSGGTRASMGSAQTRASMGSVRSQKQPATSGTRASTSQQSRNSQASQQSSSRSAAPSGRMSAAEILSSYQSSSGAPNARASTTGGAVSRALLTTVSELGSASMKPPSLKRSAGGHGTLGDLAQLVLDGAKQKSYVADRKLVQRLARATTRATPPAKLDAVVFSFADRFAAWWSNMGTELRQLKEVQLDDPLASDENRSKATSSKRRQRRIITLAGLEPDSKTDGRLKAVRANKQVAAMADQLLEEHYLAVAGLRQQNGAKAENEEVVDLVESLGSEPLGCLDRAFVWFGLGGFSADERRQLLGYAKKQPKKGSKPKIATVVRATPASASADAGAAGAEAEAAGAEAETTAAAEADDAGLPESIADLAVQWPIEDVSERAQSFAAISARLSSIPRRALSIRRRESRAAAIPDGQRVRISGLRARPELNGTYGRTTAFDAARGRHAVELEGLEETLKLRPSKLEACGEEAAAAAAEGEGEQTERV